jgi:putative NADPH-quinone reductase
MRTLVRVSHPIPGRSGTNGRPKAAIGDLGYNLYPVRELLRPLEVNAHVVGMTLTEPLALYGIPDVSGLVVACDPAARIVACAARYRTLLAG